MHTFVIRVAKKLGVSEREVFSLATTNEEEAEFYWKGYRISLNVHDKILEWCVANHPDCC